MTVVTEHLVQLIAKQVDDKGLVVWYDPEQSYVAAAAELVRAQPAAVSRLGSSGSRRLTVLTTQDLDR